MKNFNEHSVAVVTNRQSRPLPPLVVREYPAMPVPLNVGEPPAEEYDKVDIRVISIGPLGSMIVALLSRNLAGVTCHEVLPDQSGDSAIGLEGLILSVTSADLAFIITEFGVEHWEPVTQIIGKATVDAGIPTVVVTPCNAATLAPQTCDVSLWCDTLFSASAQSLPQPENVSILNSDSVIAYSIRQVISVITSLLTHRSAICIDFADLKVIMQHGEGILGVGVGSGITRAEDAAKGALQRLEGQGIRVADARGILAAVHGSSLIKMDDYDAASRVIHDHASNDADLLVGLIIDEALGANIKVSVLAVHPN